MSDEGRYSKVSRRMWNDEKFRNLSAPPPNAQTLFIRLLIGPELTCVPGLFQATMEDIATKLRWSKGFGKGFREGTHEAFAEVLGNGLAKHDEEVGLWFLPNAIFHNEPQNPNVVRSWKVPLLELPECALKQEATAHLAKYCREKGESWEKAFREVLGKPFRKPLGNHSRKQEQEQEQEQEQDSSAANSPKAEAEKPKAPRRKPKRAISPEWSPAPRHFAKAAEMSVDCERAAEKFRGHAESVDRRCVDWDRAFDNWLLNERPGSAAVGRGSPVSRPGVGFDPFARAAAKRAQETAEAQRECGIQ